MSCCGNILMISFSVGLCVQDVEPDFAHTAFAAKLSINRNKNRYINIIPCESLLSANLRTSTSPSSSPPPDDHSRVILALQENTPGSDYINASYIDVCLPS